MHSLTLALFQADIKLFSTAGGVIGHRTEIQPQIDIRRR
jgi:hypothetical protein